MCILNSAILVFFLCQNNVFLFLVVFLYSILILNSMKIIRFLPYPYLNILFSVLGACAEMLLYVIWSENSLRPSDLIRPYFIIEGGKNRRRFIYEGICRYSVDLLIEEVKECYDLGMRAVALFSCNAKRT